MVLPFNVLALNRIKPSLIFGSKIQRNRYTPINLSISNSELLHIDISNPSQCQNYIDQILEKNRAEVTYGGYLEKRNLYKQNPNFTTTDDNFRNVHLGIDFWTKSGTEVIVPFDGTVHSFKNNAIKGDYGPTIVLKHDLIGCYFHTLYGHLSLDSLEDIFVGKVLKKGSKLGSLGTSDINVNYAPHLHFQLILDMENKYGDYPGVCAVEDLSYYKKNCPDPNILFDLP